MFVKGISLQNFRNFDAKTLIFINQTVVVVGPNAVGKTNILESINLLATGKSFHTRLEEEVVREGEEIARVKGVLTEIAKKPLPTLNLPLNSENEELEAVVVRGKGKGSRKRFFINGVAKHLYNFAGRLKVVLFGPWDLDLVVQSPSLRRDFLDNVLSQVDREYRRCLLSYQKGLRQRNKVLEKIREGLASRSQLIFWDQLLIKNGDYLSAKREEFINFTNQTPGLNDQEFSLEYDRSAISAGRIEKYAQEEVAAGKTLVGPHRDDFVFIILNPKPKKIAPPGGRNYKDLAGSQGEPRKNRDLAIYGSRGEQRMGVLWLKLAELEFIENKTGQRPVLLLDDIFSELDHKHRDVVMSTVGEQQTIITTADPHFVEGLGGEVQVINLGQEG